MKKLIPVFFGLLILAGCAQQSSSNPANSLPSTASTSSSQTPVSSTEVTIENFSFNPPSLTIKAGETVVWTNKDAVSHTVTSDDGAFVDSQTMSQGSSYSFKFSTPGTYNYHCSIHPMMKGTIVVQ